MMFIGPQMSSAYLVLNSSIFQKAVCLYDLYLGNNKISNNREIFHLKVRNYSPDSLIG